MLKLSFVLEAIDRATAPVRKLNRLINQVTAPVRRVRASLADLGRESGIPRLASAVGDVRTRFNGLVGDLRAVRNGLFFVAAAAAAAIYPIKRTLDQTGDLKDTAETLGLTVREMQRLSYVFTLDGSSMQDAAVSLQFLQQNAVAALTGSEEMASWFERAGISSGFLARNLKDPKALLYALADGIQRLRTPAARLTLLKALLGRSSARLAIALANGSKGLKRFGDEAESLGAVLDDQAVESIYRADKSIFRMQQSLGGLLGVITEAAAPVIEEISAAVREWAKANRELIRNEAKKFFDNLKESLPVIWKRIKQVTAAIGEIVRAADAAAQFFGGWGNVLKIVAAIIAAQTVVSLLKLIWAIKALSVLMVTTPFGLFLTGLAALAAIGLAVYNNWDKVVATFKDAVRWVEDLILKLDDLTPKWLKFVNPGALALGTAAERIRSDRFVQQMGPVNVGGLLRIELEGGIRPRVRELTSVNPDVPIEVFAGPIVEMSR